MRRVTCLAALLMTLASAAYADPIQLLVASVTCIPNANSAQSCFGEPNATSAHWRVINWLGGADSGGWHQEDTPLTNVTLTFESGAGTRSWNWDVVQPLYGYAETTEIPIDIIRSLERLTLSATVGRTEFWWGSDYRKLVLTDTSLTASTTGMPPLDLFATGELVDLPIPEPATLVLLASGVVPLLAKRRHRSRH